MGGLYWSPDVLVKDVLAPKPDPEARRPAVLDIGCGTGRWLSQVAKGFPHADFVGIDLVPSSFAM